MEKIEKLRQKVQEKEEFVGKLESEYEEMNRTINSYIELSSSNEKEGKSEIKKGNEKDCLVFHGVKVDKKYFIIKENCVNHLETFGMEKYV